MCPKCLWVIAFMCLIAVSDLFFHCFVLNCPEAALKSKMIQTKGLGVHKPVLRTC